MSWVTDFISGIFIWSIAVIGLPLILVVAVYIYIEGGPEIIALIERTIGRGLHFIVSGIREILDEIAKIKFIGIIKNIWAYVLSIIVLYLLLMGSFEYSYLASMIGAFIENTLKEWSGMVIFWSMGVMVLVVKVLDSSSPFLSLSMLFFPVILTMSTLTLVNMLGSSRNGGGGLYHRGNGRSSIDLTAGAVGGLRALLSGGIEGAMTGTNNSQVPLVAAIRPLIFLIGAFYCGVQGMLAQAFVLCTIAALVEIANEQWFETATFVSLAMMVLVAQAADFNSPLLTATMFVLPLAIALSAMAPRSPPPDHMSSSSSSPSSSPSKEYSSQQNYDDDNSYNNSSRY